MLAQRGFSLLELLVVLLIIGITVSMASLGVTAASSERDLVRYGEWFAREAALGLQEAEAEGRHRGAALYQDADGRWQWQWYTHREGRWQLLETAHFAAAEAPRDTDARLEVDGVQVAIGGRSGRPDKPQPDIVLYNSGELTPFVFTLSLATTTTAVTICAKAVGKISVLQFVQGDGACEVPS